MEDYLEAIAQLKEDKGIARVKDISRLLNVRTPSVTGALEALSRNSLVLHEPYGAVTLTPAGRRRARSVRKRHKLLVRFLTDVLRVEDGIALEDACRMEHSLSPQTFRKLTQFIDSVKAKG